MMGIKFGGTLLNLKPSTGQDEGMRVSAL